MALNYKIESDGNFLPLMLRFDPAKNQIVSQDPLKLASRKAWGNRLKSYRRFETAFEVANCVVFDDLHYVFEHLSTTRSILPTFLRLIKEVWRKAEERYKVLMIGEDILFPYIWTLHNKEVTDFLLANKEPLRDCFSSINDYMEIPISASHWNALLNVYGLTLEPYATNALFETSKGSPRGLLVLANLFKARHITDELFCKVALEKLTHDGVDRGTLVMYEWLMKNAPEYSNKYWHRFREIGIRPRDVAYMYPEERDRYHKSERFLLEPFERAFGTLLRGEP